MNIQYVVVTDHWKLHAPLRTTRVPGMRTQLWVPGTVLRLTLKFKHWNPHAGSSLISNGCDSYDSYMHIYIWLHCISLQYIYIYDMTCITLYVYIYIYIHTYQFITDVHTASLDERRDSDQLGCNAPGTNPDKTIDVSRVHGLIPSGNLT